jgi:hypothetical protein
VTGALAILLALAGSAAAERPHLATFDCQIGDRTHILVPRSEEESHDDELECRALVAGLRPGGAAELAGEVRVRAPDGRVRTVATGVFDRDEGRARLELLVPHATWASAITWQTSWRPYLQLTLHVFFRQESRKRWWPLFTRTLVIDHHPRRRSR